MIAGGEPTLWRERGGGSGGGGKRLEAGGLPKSEREDEREVDPKGEGGEAAAQPCKEKVERLLLATITKY